MLLHTCITINHFLIRIATGVPMLPNSTKKKVQPTGPRPTERAERAVSTDPELDPGEGPWRRGWEEGSGRGGSPGAESGRWFHVVTTTVTKHDGISS